MANLGNDHGFISKEYTSIGMRPFEKAQSKVIRAYTQRRQYHTIVEIRNSKQASDNLHYSINIAPPTIWYHKFVYDFFPSKLL